MHECVVWPWWLLLGAARTSGKMLNRQRHLQNCAALAMRTADGGMRCLRIAASMHERVVRLWWLLLGAARAYGKTLNRQRYLIGCVGCATPPSEGAHRRPRTAACGHWWLRLGDFVRKCPGAHLHVR